MKHAYLIAAHNQFELLDRLLSTLDASNNDIYLHIDKKAGDIDVAKIQKSLKYSCITLLDRKDITWGGYSQVELEVAFLETAIRKTHDYYHFISGADFPIKSNEEIDAFFEQNYGKEFIHFDKKTDINEISYRIGRYHFLQEYIGRNEGYLRKLETLCVKLQKLVGMNRLQGNNIEYRKGANWFSITDDFARYVVAQKECIQKMYKYSICADEIFLQTLAYNSEFRGQLYFSDKEGRFFNMRLIDWNRGNPYVFRNSDFDELMSSDCLFARKFDMQQDSKIIERLQGKLKANGMKTQ